MAQFLNATFTVSSLTPLGSYSAELGGPFVAFIGPEPSVYSTLGGVVGGNSGLGVWRGSTIAPSADVVISAQFYYDSSNFNSTGVVGRANSAGNACYLAALIAGSMKWGIYRVGSSGSTTLIAQAATASSYTSGDTPSLVFSITGTGASVALSLSINGSTLVTTTDTDALRIISAGYAGIWFSSIANGQGMFIGAMSADTSSGGGGSITITGPTSERIIQRASGVAAIPVTGTYTGTPSAIEARLVLDGTNTAVTGFDWASKVPSPTGGAFSFSFASAPENVWYNVQVRDSAVPGTVITSGRVGVGALVAVLGQSNAWLWFQRGDSTLTPNAKLRVIGSGSDNGISSANVPKVWSVPSVATMNAAISCGNRLVTALNTLVALVDVTWDGSGLTVPGNGGQWVPTATAGQPYDRAKTFLNTITSKIEAAVIVNGETDGANGVTQANFYSGMTTLITAIRADFGVSTTPVVTPLLGKRTDGAITDANAQTIRNAQVQKAADTAIYRVEREDLTRNADGVHLDPTGFTALGNRCAQSINFSKGAATFYRGMQLTSAVKVDNSTFDVTLTTSGGTDFSGTSGFTALDGSSVINATAARLTTTTARLTLASPASSLPTIRYLYGTAPDVTAPLLDNTSLALPLEFNNGVVATNAGSPTTRTITIKLVDYFGNALAGLTGLKWAVHAEKTPDLWSLPVAQGAVETTDGAGTEVITFNTALTAGAVASLTISNSDGVVATNHSAFCGPVDLT